MRYDQPRVGHVLLASPGLDIGKAGESSVFGYGYHSLAGLHLLDYILRSTLGDSCTSFLR